jgi:hypothetical protein
MYVCRRLFNNIEFRANPPLYTIAQVTKPRLLTLGTTLITSDPISSVAGGISTLQRLITITRPFLGLSLRRFAAAHSSIQF